MEFLILFLAAGLALAQEKPPDLVIGKVTYPNATILRVLPDSFLILYEDEVARIPIEDIPEPLRIKHGLTMEKAAAFRREASKRAPLKSVSPVPGQHGETIVEGPVNGPLIPAPAAGEQLSEMELYKAAMRRKIVKQWDAKTDQHKAATRTGSLKARVLVRADGTIEKVLIRDRSADTDILETVARESIEHAAPFEPFTESMKRKYPEGYTAEFKFGIEIE